MVSLRATIKDQAPELIVNSEAVLDATLDEASAEARTAGKLNIILLTAPNRDWLSIVVGGEDTVVGYNCGHGDTPYYVSAGQVQTDDPIMTAYVGLKHHTEFPRQWVVAIDAGRQAAREFLATGKRPDSIEWTEA
jgi:Immunity protein Imm1